MFTPKVGIFRLRMLEKLRRLKHIRVSLKNHVFVSVLTTMSAVIMLLFMTGVQVFNDDVIITADGVTKKFFSTKKENAEEILTEAGCTIGEFDRIVYREAQNGYNSYIDLIRGYGIEVEVDGEVLAIGAVEGETAELILAASGIEVGRYDAVISGENKISLIRGFPVSVTADGQTVEIGTVGSTVEELLQRAGITPGEDDIVNMPLGASLSDGDEIVVKRVVYRDRTDVEYLQYEQEVQYSNLVAMNQERSEGGVLGEVTAVYHEKVIDGTVVESAEISREITKEPITEVVYRGNALQTPYSKRDFPEIVLENGLPTDYVAKHTGKSTAYTAPATSGTASGRPLQIGTVAVDPAKIPYGSLLYIVSTCGNYVYGAAIAADTGEFILYSDVIVDVFMGVTSENYHEALRWGGKYVDVYVINTGVY